MSVSFKAAYHEANISTVQTTGERRVWSGMYVLGFTLRHSVSILDTLWYMFLRYVFTHGVSK